ncbi:MAG: hypothetical protein ACLFOY_12575 [Desulfatibacillaceae bacterium]
MDLCATCPLEEKIHVCCARHPETLETRMMPTPGGGRLSCCSMLGDNGECLDYHSRPRHCREFVCERSNNPFER